MIIVDDMRPNLNAAYGQEHMITPNLDRLALSAGTVVFNHAYAQAAHCAPSRASFLTSRYPDTLQIWGVSKSFRDTAERPIPLPQWFKKQGYLVLGGAAMQWWWGYKIASKLLRPGTEKQR